MKKMLLMAVTAISVTMSVNAQDDALQPYFELDQLPQLINIMPPPPAFDSPEFANDVVRYGWGKLQRNDDERHKPAEQEHAKGQAEGQQNAFGVYRGAGIQDCTE